MELKTYINKILGDNIRCILPSYWWKRLFGLVIDSIENEVGSVKRALDTKATKSEVSSINAKIETLESNASKSCRFYVPLTLEGNQITTLTAEQIKENKASVSLLRYSGNIDDYDIRLYWYNNSKPLPLAIRSITVIGDTVEITSNFAELDFPSEHFNFLWKHTISSDGQATSELMRNGGMPIQIGKSQTMTLKPNTYCRMISSAFNYIEVQLGESTGSDSMDNYMFEFTTPSSGFKSIKWPEGIRWQNREEPAISGGWTYKVSIVNNLAVIAKF